MTYAVGVDIGTSYSAAAIWRDGRAETVPLGDRATTVPSVLFLRDDGVMLVGDAADRRAITAPARVAREFKRRIGDRVPVVLGTESFSAEHLVGQMLRWVVDKVAELEGAPPDYAVLCHPASWGEYRRSLLADAAAAAGLPAAGLVPEPVAAGLYYASQTRVPAGALIGVYDLGGGTFDATILRKAADGFTIVGTPGGDDHCGGVDVDQLVLERVVDAVGPAWPADAAAPTVLQALAQVRAAAVDAKEALSVDTQAVVPVILPGYTGEVQLTRAELESGARPLVAHTIDVLQRTCTSADVEPADLHAVLLVGGSSRIPLVAQLVASELGRPVAVDAHPKHAVCLGAAIAAATRLSPTAVPAGRSATPAAGAAAAVVVVADLAEAEVTAPSDTPLPRSRRAPERPLRLTDHEGRVVVHVASDQDGQRARVLALVAASVVAIALVLGAVLVLDRGPSDRPAAGGVARDGAGDASSVATGGRATLVGQPIPGADGGAMLDLIPVGDRRMLGVGHRGGPAVWWSNDGGSSWQAGGNAPGAGGRMAGLTAVDGQAPVAVGSLPGAEADDTRAAVWRATDPAGSSWALVQAEGLAGAATLQAVIGTGGQELLAVGRHVGRDPRDGDGGVWRSPDAGRTWQLIETDGLAGPGPQEVHQIIRTAAGGYVAVGRQLRGAATGPAVWTSPDATTWTEAPGIPEAAGGTPTLHDLVELSDGALLLAGTVTAPAGATQGQDPALWWAPAGDLAAWRPLDLGDTATLAGNQELLALLADANRLVAAGAADQHATTWEITLALG